MMRAVEELLHQLKKDGSAESLLPRMQPRQELYDLLGYSEYQSKDAQLAEQYPT